MAALLEARVELWGSHKQYWGSGPPVNSSDCVGEVFNVGDVLWNNAPANGGPLGWYCVVASTAIGNPGTWLPFAIIGGAGQGSAFGVTGKQIAHAQYNFANDGGTETTITVKNNATIPANAIITNVYLNSPTALAGTGASVAVGTTAGSSSTALLAATAITNFGTDAMYHGVPTPATANTWVKLSAAGQITVTISAAALTAGVLDIYVEFVVSESA